MAKNTEIDSEKTESVRIKMENIGNRSESQGNKTERVFNTVGQHKEIYPNNISFDGFGIHDRPGTQMCISKRPD